MKTLRTQEQMDGSHIVIAGRIGQYGKGDTIPRDVAMKMRAGRPVDVGNGYVLAGKGGSARVH